MSRIGLAPIQISSKVSMTIDENNFVTVKGPKGELEQQFPPCVQIISDGSVINLSRVDDTKTSRALHGLSRALLANMVTGVTEGFTKRLEIQGVGYRVDKDGDNLIMRLGFSHTVVVVPLPGITLSNEGTTNVLVSGIDKQVVGQMAANIRKLRPVEPYKGKGIRYSGERVRRKAGKSAKVGG